MSLPTCIDCNEPDSAGCPGWRCRACDIAHVTARSSCRECGASILREEFAGPRASQHKPGCSLATSDDYGPLPMHGDVWKAALGTLADTADDYERTAAALAAGDLRGDLLRAVVVDLRARAERWRGPSAAGGDL